MPETNEQTVQQETLVTPTPEAVKPPEEDLVTRASKVKTETQAKTEIDEKFNINDLDAKIEQLPDPALKEQVLGLKKSLLKGENQKYQEIANLRKQYESKLAESTNWTPERIQGLLQDPNFVKAAQSIVNTPPTSAETSMLTDAEKRQLDDNNRQVQALMYQNQQLLRTQQDGQLKQRYANYDANMVDQTFNDMLNGRVQATREHIWKVVDYEQAVQRAYELGKQDRNIQNQERAAGISFETGRNMPQPTTVERQKGETTAQFLQRSYQKHIKEK